MTNRIRYLVGRLRASIWFIPLALCALGGGLGRLALWADRHLPEALSRSSDLAMSVDSARQVLSVIAGSVISVAGVSFSVTMVALTLTSGQYGPKVLRNFLEDNTSKVSLGLFLGVYVYALVVLTGYTASDRPDVSVIAALLFALLAIVGFIRFIHRIATDLQADQVVERIGQALMDAFDHLLDEPADIGRSDVLVGWRRAVRGKRPRLIATVHDGYVQSIDYDAVVDWCRRHQCHAQVRVRAGDFVTEGICAFKVYGATAEHLAEAAPALNDLLVTGPVRTATQDPEYPITQLNQLAARALSPGINDPGTAISCIDSFSLALARIVDRDLPGSVFLDAAGAPRVLARLSGFEGILKAIFAQLRQFARSEVSVIVSLFEALCRLSELTTRRDRLALLAMHGELLWDGVDDGAISAYDFRDIRQRYRRLCRLTQRRDAAA